MYESNLSFAQAEIAFRTEQIATARSGKRRLTRLARGRRGVQPSDTHH
ncbi:hypothetical protein [Nocardioides ungokensis]|nr:hypothetical protein [Nocardioides ungokensis]